MACIAANNEGLMKKDVLGFLRRHLMPLPVLVGVAFVPVKPDAIPQ